MENKEEKTLALELMHELKQASKRWFIAFLVTLCLWFGTVVGFLWYISLPAEDYSVSQKADDRSFNLINGGDYYGGETDYTLYEESSEE